MNTTAVRRSMAENFLRDAALETSSIDSRATAAFDAGYFFPLVALEAPTGGLNGRHPGLDLLTQAAATFRLALSVMAPAWQFIAQQYSPTNVKRLLDDLCVWAEKMKQLTVTDGP